MFEGNLQIRKQNCKQMFHGWVGNYKHHWKLRFKFSGLSFPHWKQYWKLRFKFSGLSFPHWKQYWKHFQGSRRPIGSNFPTGSAPSAPIFAYSKQHWRHIYSHWKHFLWEHWKVFSYRLGAYSAWFFQLSPIVWIIF